MKAPHKQFAHSPKDSQDEGMPPNLRNSEKRQIQSWHKSQIPERHFAANLRELAISVCGSRIRGRAEIVSDGFPQKQPISATTSISGECLTPGFSFEDAECARTAILGSSSFITAVHNVPAVK